MPLSGYPIFAASVPWALLAPLGCDDLATAELASVVGGFDPFRRMFSLLKVSTVHKIYGAADFSKQIIAAVVPHYWFAPFCFQSFPVSEGSALRPWVSELFHKITTSLVVCLDLCLPDVAHRLNV